jgi:ribosomal protein S18 acetylase RimI-like enzyme
VFYTVDNEGELIGELYAFLDLPDKDFADGKNTAYLCAFRIRKEYRGRGLGSRLMTAALNDLKSAGFLTATIGVNDRRNKELYERMGFVKFIKTCYFDPCAMTSEMQPERDETGYILLAKEL